jgi:two-component system cell cycle response regulator
MYTEEVSAVAAAGRGVAEPDPASEATRQPSGRSAQPAAAQATAASEVPETGAPTSTNLVELHESIAALLSSCGQWRQAYHHLRCALDLVHAGQTQAPTIPEQLRREVDQLRKAHAEAHEQSLRDSLTASYNRRYLDQRLVTLVAEQQGTPGGIAVALADLDWFKQVNDTFGHLVGDRVLQRVVELLQEDLPDGAFCARYGGEEFALVLPGIDAPRAVAVAEAARARVEHYPWSKIALGLRVTVSVGLDHQATGDHDDMEPERQLLRADGLLYTAKQSGRNAVAYLVGGRAYLAGAAGGRRAIVDPPAIAT